MHYESRRRPRRCDTVRILAATAIVSACGVSAAWAGEPTTTAPATTTPATSAPATETPATMTPEAAVQRLTPSLTPPYTSPEGAELDAAEKSLREAATKEPKSARWQYGLARVARLRAGDLTGEARITKNAEYLKHAAAAASLDAKNADYHFEHGQAIMASIKPDDGFMTMADKAGEAKEQWEQGLEINADHISCRIAIGQYELQARRQGGFLFGSYKKARKHGEHLLKLSDGAFHGHVLLGQIAAAEEEWDEMSKQFGLAEKLAANPQQEYQALMAHASALGQQKKDAKAALALADKLVAVAPEDDTSAFYVRGSARKQTGDCAGAIADFAKVIERNPEAPNSRFFLAECQESTGDTAGAITSYTEFKKRFPKDDRASKAEAAIKRLNKKKS
jgi:hypothetical protein